MRCILPVAVLAALLSGCATAPSPTDGPSDDVVSTAAVQPVDFHDVVDLTPESVRDIATDPSDAAIVQTIISISHTLRLQVVAEGVEIAEQHAFLEANRCGLFQGYLFGRPMPLADFELLLAQSPVRRDAAEKTT